MAVGSVILTGATLASAYIYNPTGGGGGAANPSLPFNGVQYNNGGVFGANSNFTLDPSTNVFNLITPSSTPNEQSAIGTNLSSSSIAYQNTVTGEAAGNSCGGGPIGCDISWFDNFTSPQHIAAFHVSGGSGARIETDDNNAGTEANFGLDTDTNRLFLQDINGNQTIVADPQTFQFLAGDINRVGNGDQLIINPPQGKTTFLTSGTFKIKNSTDTLTPFTFDAAANLVDIGDTNGNTNGIDFQTDIANDKFHFKTDGSLDIKDTSGDLLFGVDSPTIFTNVGTSLGYDNAPVSGNYNISPGDYYLSVDTTSTAGNLTLPSAAIYGNKTSLTYIVTDYLGHADTNNITLIPQAGDTINGLGLYVINVKNGAVMLYSDGGNNWIASTYSGNSNGTTPDNSTSALASTTGALPASTYDNGTAGVGATLTENSNGALPPQDGVTLMNGDLLLVQNQASQLENGLEVVTDAGSPSTPFVLTRDANADETDEMNSLVVIPAQGATLADRVFGQTTSDPVIGTDPIVFATQPSTLNVTQAPAGTQVKFQIPVWTGAARQLLKGTSNFTYNTRFKRLVLDSVENTVNIGSNTPLPVAGNVNGIFIGNGAGNATTVGANSVFIGTSAGSGATAADATIFIGENAGLNAAGADHSEFIGSNAGNGAANANESFFAGDQAGDGSNTNGGSVNIGYRSGFNDTSTAPSILIGGSTNAGAFNNVIAFGVGSSVAATASGQFIIDPAVTQFDMRGINWTMPSAQGGSNTVLTNDGSGNLSWAAPTVSSLAWSAITGTPTTLAGYGITNAPTITGTGDVTAQNAANASIAAFTTGGATSTYRIGGYLNITALSLDVIQLQCTYTDENSNVQTVILATGSTVVDVNVQDQQIRAKNGTAITIKTVLTTGTGSITYDSGGTIEKVR